MERFLIEVPHTAEGCKHALEQFLAAGFLTHFEWGCLAGEHTGWAIIEAENEAQARLVVPSFERPHARVVKLHRFTVEEIQAAHT